MMGILTTGRSKAVMLVVFVCFLLLLLLFFFLTLWLFAAGLFSCFVPFVVLSLRLMDPV